MSDRNQLTNFLLARHRCISIVTVEEEEALALVRHVALELNRPLWIWAAHGGVREGLLADSASVSNTEDPVAGLAYLASLDQQPLLVPLDLSGHLRNEKPLRAFRNLLMRAERTQAQIILLNPSDDLPDVVRAHSTPLELSLPDDVELEATVRATLRRVNENTPLDIDITRHGLQTLLRNLRGLSTRVAEQVIRDALLDRRFDDADINHVLAGKRRALQGGGLLEFIESPVDLGEIGGLATLKRWLAQRQRSFTPEAVEYGLPAPRGVLMLGVQGAGKSLCAKAIATAWQRPLLRLDVGALYDKYVGESERRLRDALRQAQRMAPIVLWIDEIEKAFASAASRSTDGGLSQRMFGELLTWMQEHREPVFLVATANDIEALPSELLRKGRFDEIFFVDLPDESTRREILAIHLRKRRRDPKLFDLAALAAAGDGFSGAEIEQAIVAAAHAAFSERRAFTTADILAALRASPPLAVTMREHVTALREWAQGRCVRAD
ncbi:MAG: AAA family ATPase [Phycisphaerae bacterium]